MPNIIATGIAKRLAFKKETALGVSTEASGQLLRRITSDINLSKDTYQSEEITSTYQISDFRHGSRKIGGSIKGHLSPGTYSLFMAAALRRDFSVVAAITGASLTIAGVGPTYTVPARRAISSQAGCGSAWSCV
jgi:hypothetical protein